MSLYKAEKAVRAAQVAELVKVISGVVSDWPRDVRVPEDLQRAIAAAVLDSIQH